MNKPDQTLADYIKRINQVLVEEDVRAEQTEDVNDYKVYPEIEGESDHKRNPYSRV